MLVTTVTALAAIIVTFWIGGTFNSLICGGDCGASGAAPPDGLAFEPQTIEAQANTPPSSGVDPAAVRDAVASLLRDEKLGEHVGFAAVDVRTGEVLVTEGQGAFVPASTAKLLTALAVLSTLDPQQHFVTSVVRSGDQLVLVGGGDPYLMSEPPEESHPAFKADLRTLAGRTARALRQQGISSVRLGYDADLFSGPRLSPSWEDSYLAELVVTPISALWADQVLATRPDEPSGLAAKQFAEFLKARGIDVAGEPSATTAPAAATRVAAVRGPTLAQATELMVLASDNDAAEMLLRHSAIGAGRPGTFDDGLAVVADVLRRRGIQTQGLALYDGSGLSRENRIAPVTLAQVVAEAATDARTGSLLSGLPTARFSGTLDDRFSEAKAGRGVVRAKTGTLSGVHSLAGYVNDQSGVPIAFAVMVDKTKELNEVETEAALDQVAAALARCDCSVPG
jgi:D-alanyl-D-alanine carboxypeptidase/D-alanyl-D-alanine-endopeptidase (penicillin-binding protein 4)